MNADIRRLRKSHQALVQVFTKLEHASDGSTRRLLVNELLRRLTLQLEAHNTYLVTRVFGSAIEGHSAQLVNGRVPRHG
jgi:hypothetical protein